MGFGNKLKEILKKRGITIKELSAMSGISLNTLYSITKRDTQMPDKEIVNKIATALNINISELYTFDMLDSELSRLINQQKQSEEKLRKMLSDLVLMLNGDALNELIENALELLRYEAYWSLFHDRNAIKTFVGDKIIPLSDSETGNRPDQSDK